MKYLAHIFFLVASALSLTAAGLFAQIPPLAPPQPVKAETTVIVEKLSPDQMEILIWKWTTVIGTAITALAGTIALVLAKYKELKERLNRKETRDNHLHEQVIQHLKDCVPPHAAPPASPAATPPPAPPLGDDTGPIAPK